MNAVTIVGAGLAGCEAAWQLAKRGIRVKLIEMKPACYSPAHQSPDFAELVCSNSLKAEHLTNASGLLKAEMEKLGSLTVETAKKVRVPAGAALAVDRGMFAKEITRVISQNPLIEVERRVVGEIPTSPAIIATGPLTHDELARDIARRTGHDSLRFFDAEAPIVAYESIDMSVAFRASRYGKGD
ncbi:MAG: FAD-dependent oxidoreductase, partial [Clostridia bacterium]|nr:FAD-dependent oxidoreductase [Clostridia bacterium]